MYFNHRFKDKPQGKQCGWVQKSLTQVNITIENLADALVHGASFKPGVLAGGNKAENWIEQQLFGLDFDDGIKIKEAYNKVISLGITPCFMYTTFSHKEEHHKFRMIFCNDTVITDGNIRDKLQATLMGTIGGIDEVCFNRDRLFFGGKGHTVLYPDYDTRINAESIIEKYWNDDFEQYISNAKPKSKKKKDSTAAGIKNKDRKSKNIIVYEDNTDAISTLNIPLLQERLGIKGDLIGTDRRRYSLLVPTQSPEAEKSGRCENGVYQFQSEAEMYNYINSIDLQEYLGVPSGTFCCILPTHEDNKPSAHIYITDDGTQIYKCFGCNQARTIISITEQLAHCKRSEAINFIKRVYGIDYKPSEWVEQQRQLMIDSALYLDSEEFKETFPQINKLIRTRKADIQKILMHMTKYISDGLQLDGKPLFFASLTSLMKVCERNSKPKMSQSITLFALLNMLNKVELNCIPEDELKKAKQISAKYGFKKIVNFYQIEEYGFTTLEDSEKIAATLLDNNMTLKGLSREYILRTFGVDLADKVYPQFKFENRQGTSAKSDYLTGEIALVVLETIKDQGYIFERNVNLNGTIGTQWKKSIQEILNSYGLRRVKLNKELKEKYGIKTNGYPCIIIEVEEENYCQKQKMD
jgi:hypothetical protein